MNTDLLDERRSANNIRFVRSLRHTNIPCLPFCHWCDHGTFVESSVRRPDTTEDDHGLFRSVCLDGPFSNGYPGHPCDRDDLFSIDRLYHLVDHDDRDDSMLELLRARAGDLQGGDFD